MSRIPHCLNSRLTDGGMLLVLIYVTGLGHSAAGMVRCIEKIVHLIRSRTA
jgi:hypothetical protein